MRSTPLGCYSLCHRIIVERVGHALKEAMCPFRFWPARLPAQRNLERRKCRLLQSDTGPRGHHIPQAHWPWARPISTLTVNQYTLREKHFENHQHAGNRALPHESALSYTSNLDQTPGSHVQNRSSMRAELRTQRRKQKSKSSPHVFPNQTTKSLLLLWASLTTRHASRTCWSYRGCARSVR